MIELRDDTARIEVHPGRGAAIGRYDFVSASGQVLPIFQVSPSTSRQGPFALGLNLLVPFSNRISGGGFCHDGVFHALDRNAADRYPVHGNALTMQWTVRDRSPSAASLTLVSNGPGPFRYTAEVTYQLKEGALTSRLLVVNRAATSLPFGAGFHPWFVRSSDTRLRMYADGYWTSTADHLPDKYLPMQGDKNFDFAAGRLLPDIFTNNAFTGWSGTATLEWPERAISAEISAPAPLRTAIVYSPSSEANFVCIEPVSHSIDAHNRSGPGTSAPQILGVGEELIIESTIQPFSL